MERYMSHNKIENVSGGTLSILMYTDPSRFPDANLADASNYCRAPDGSSLPWCYKTLAEQRWDYCDFERIFWGKQTTSLTWGPSGADRTQVGPMLVP